MSTLQEVGDIVLLIGDDLRDVIKAVSKSESYQACRDQYHTVEAAMPADKWLKIKERMAGLEEAIQGVQGTDSLSFSFRGKMGDIKDEINAIDQTVTIHDPATMFAIETVNKNLKRMAGHIKDIREMVKPQCGGGDMAKRDSYDSLLKTWYKLDGEIQEAIDLLHFEEKVMNNHPWDVKMPCEKLKAAGEILMKVESMILSPDFRGGVDVLPKVREVRNIFANLMNVSSSRSRGDETAGFVGSELDKIRSLSKEIMKGWAQENQSASGQGAGKQESDYSKDLREAGEAVRRLPDVNEPYRTDIDATLKEIMFCFEGEAYIAVMCLCGRVLEAALKMRIKLVPNADVDVAIKKEYGDTNTRSGKDKGKAWTLDDMTLGQIDRLIDDHFSEVVKLPPALKHTIETIAIYRNSNVHARATGVSRFPDKKSAGMIIAAIIILVDQSCVAISEKPQTT